MMKFKNKKIDIYIYILLGLSLIYAIFLTQIADEKFFNIFSLEWEDQGEMNNILWNVTNRNWKELLNYQFSDNYFKVHIAPIYLIISNLFYRFKMNFAGVYTPIIYLISFSSITLYLTSKKYISKLSAFLIATAFLASPIKANLFFLDGDATIYIMPLSMLSMYFIQKQNFKLFTFSTVLVAMCRTQTPLTAALLALFYYCSNKDKKTIYLSILFFIWFILNMYLHGSFSVETVIQNSEAGGFLNFNADSIVQMIKGYSIGHLNSILIVLAPLLFLPIRSPIFLLSIPSLLMIFVTEHLTYQRAHYFTGLITFSFLALPHAISKIKEKYHLYITGFILISSFTLNFTVNTLGTSYPSYGDYFYQGLTKFVNYDSIYKSTPSLITKKEIEALHTAYKLIPDNKSVSATSESLPYLSARKKVRTLLDEYFDYMDVDYILIFNKFLYFGAGSYPWDSQEINNLINKLDNSSEWNKLYMKENVYLYEKKN